MTDVLGAWSACEPKRSSRSAALGLWTHASISGPDVAFPVVTLRAEPKQGKHRWWDRALGGRRPRAETAAAPPRPPRGGSSSAARRFSEPRRGSGSRVRADADVRWRLLVGADEKRQRSSGTTVLSSSRSPYGSSIRSRSSARETIRGFLRDEEHECNRLRRISAPRTSARAGRRRLARERAEVLRHSFQCGRARDHSWSSSDRLTDWAAPPRRLGRRRSHTTSCARCANGWLVDGCRRDICFALARGQNWSWGGYHDMAHALIVALEPILRLRSPPRSVQNRKSPATTPSTPRTVLMDG